MNAIVKSSTFKTGNSVAVRLPKGFGVGPGEDVEIVKHGPTIEIKVVAQVNDERAKLASFVERMKALGPVVGGNPQDGRIEFPDRPGLY